MVSHRSPLTSRAPRGAIASAADGVAVGGFALFFGLGATAWLAAARAHDELLLLIVALPLGIALADLVTGVVHWAGDTFFEEDTPILGRHWIRPFREHHRDPLAIVRHGFLEVSGNTCWLLVGLLVAMRAVGPGLESAGGRMAWAALLAFCVSIAASNHLHRWAHADTPPRLIRGLQRCGMALPPRAHDRHHDGLHDRAFCVTTGWCNTLLDRLDLFRRLENVLGARRDDSHDATASGS